MQSRLHLIGNQTLRRLTGRFVTVLTALSFLGAAVLALLQGVDLEGNSTVIFVETFTTYAFAVIYPAVVVALLRRQRWLAVIAVPLIAQHLLWIVTAAMATSPPPGIDRVPHMTIYQQNVHGDVNTDPVALGNGIRASNADIVVLQEMVPKFQPRLEATGAISRYSFRFAHGNLAVYSTLRLTRESLLGGAPGHDVIALKMAVQIRGRSVTLYDVHMPAPLFVVAAEWTSAFARLQADASATPGPMVISGDFNATMSHHVFRDLLDSGFEDGQRLTGQGWERSWPADGGWATAIGGVIRIDHVLVRGVFPSRITEGPANGSDHRSMSEDLALVS